MKLRKAQGDRTCAQLTPRHQPPQHCFWRKKAAHCKACTQREHYHAPCFGEQVWKVLWGKNSHFPKVLLCISNETKKVRESFCKPYDVVPVLTISLKNLIFFRQFSPNYSHGLFSPKTCYRFFKSSTKIKGCDLKQSFSKKFYGEVIKRENQPSQKSPHLLVQQEIR